MRFYISLGILDLKYLKYCVLFLIVQIYICLLFLLDGKNKEILKYHILLNPSCFFLGFLLNFIPTWIIQKKSNKKTITSELKKQKNNQIFEYIYYNPYVEYLSKKEIIKIFGIILFLLITEIFRIIPKIINKINENNENNENNDINEDIFIDDKLEDHFIFIEFLLIFIIPHSSEVYYRHQKFSFLIFTLIEIIKIIFFLFYQKISATLANILAIFFEIIISINYAFFYIYIKRLMKYKFISPYTINFRIGIINFPIIIIIYIIISFSSLGNNNNYFCVDNIKNLFEDFDLINAFLLISLPISYGINVAFLNKIIYDFTLYHSFIPLLIENFILDMYYIFEEGNYENFEIVFLIACFFIELIIILVFLEIIELNFCELNKNLKKNIELRALNETYLEIEDYCGNEVDDGRNTINCENK